jgi:hypothetical protein
VTRLAAFVLTVPLFTACVRPASALQSIATQSDPTISDRAITVPAGTKLELAVTAPVWARTAKPGDPLYAQVNFPVTAGNNIAIPAGTYVQGTIQAITRPTRKASRAELQVLALKIIFANGYVVAVSDEPGTGSATAGRPATAAKVTAEVNTTNDLLLDNGAQFEITLAAPLALDADKIASAIALSRAPEPGKFKSASRCRPTPGSPGSPGTPDTVIPGTPGTPDTTIPGGPGMPDITIPGTPGTPSTTIPGMPDTPGTPGTSCPSPPIVISSVPMS